MTIGLLRIRKITKKLTKLERNVTSKQKEIWVIRRRTVLNNHKSRIGYLKVAKDVNRSTKNEREVLDGQKRDGSI